MPAARRLIGQRAGASAGAVMNARMLNMSGSLPLTSRSTSDFPILRRRDANPEAERNFPA